MNREQFLEKLHQTPRKWRVTKQGKLRLGKLCPITAVAGARSSLEWHSGAQTLGINDTDAVLIFLSSDISYIPLPGSYMPFRRKLLAACGLTETKRKQEG